MTDLGGQENQVDGTADNNHGTDHHGPERRCSVQKGLGSPKRNQQEHHSSLCNVEGDFEEFVLDFDDYDLLESIHSQLGSSPEHTRKSCVERDTYNYIRLPMKGVVMQ